MKQKNRANFCTAERLSTYPERLISMELFYEDALIGTADIASV
jgi:hypothetical protein